MRPKEDSIVRGGVEYRYLENVRVNDWLHAIYLELAMAGYPIIFLGEAVDSEDRPMPCGWLAVFAAEDYIIEVPTLVEQALNSDPLRQAMRLADLGRCHALFIDYIQTGILGDELVARRLLARAFEQWAEMCERTASVSDDEFDREYYGKEAKLAWAWARRVRDLEPMEPIMEEYLGGR